MPDKKVAKQAQKKMKAVKAKLSKAQLFNLLSADSDVSTGDVKRVLGSLERLTLCQVCGLRPREASQ